MPLNSSKKRKKALTIAIPIMCACIAFVIVLTTVIIPKQKYNKAMRLLDSDDYDSAYVLFEEIGSDEAIASNKYDRAIALIDSGDYKSAYTLLNKLNYKDSEAKRLEIRPNYQKMLFSKATVGSTVFFGAYEQDNDTSNGKEDIEWLVLAKSGNKMLVISKYALDAQSYSTEATATWETSSLRTWANDTFLKAAFSANEQKRILSANVSADENPVWTVDPGNATIDKVFLLSITEAEKYFATNESRRCSQTAYVKARSSSTSSRGTTADDETACGWGLRSPGMNQFHFANVLGDGSIYCDGFRVGRHRPFFRPAMWIEFGNE